MTELESFQIIRHRIVQHIAVVRLTLLFPEYWNYQQSGKCDGCQITGISHTDLDLIVWDMSNLEILTGERRNELEGKESRRGASGCRQAEDAEPASRLHHRPSFFSFQLNSRPGESGPSPLYHDDVLLGHLVPTNWIGHIHFEEFFNTFQGDHCS